MTPDALIAWTAAICGSLVLVGLSALMLLSMWRAVGKVAARRGES